MTDYEQRVEALRETAKHLDGISRFPYDDDPAKRIYSKKMTDAADAIEALQADRDEWIDRCYHADEKVAELSQKVAELQAAQPHWVSVEERKPPEYTDVWCAVYTTDLIYVEDGETVEEAIENRQLEAARNPRVTLGSYSDDEGWTDGYFGMPMVCQPDYWLEMTIPEPPKEDV